MEEAMPTVMFSKRFPYVGRDNVSRAFYVPFNPYVLWEWIVRDTMVDDLAASSDHL